jgi:hypothetical protein
LQQKHILLKGSGWRSNWTWWSYLCSE